MFLLWFFTAVSLLLSLCAKWLADAYLVERVALLGEFAGLQPASNAGVAFGLRLPDALQLPVILLALGLVAFAAAKHAATTVSAIGFGCILGGALGNVLDRLRDGLVTDFFQIGAFPIFNLADAFITVGAVFLLAESSGLIGNNLKKQG